MKASEWVSEWLLFNANSEGNATIPKLMRSSLVFRRVHVARSLVLYVVFCRSMFVLLFLAIVLTVLLWLTASNDYIGFFTIFLVIQFRSFFCLSSSNRLLIYLAWFSRNLGPSWPCKYLCNQCSSSHVMGLNLVQSEKYNIMW